MRWLLIALIVSVGGLLLAAAGVVRHVRLHRRKMKPVWTQGDAAVVSVPEDQI